MMDYGLWTMDYGFVVRGIVVFPRKFIVQQIHHPSSIIHHP